MALVVKNPPASAGDLRDLGLIPRPGRSPGEGNGNPLSILAWRIPWAEEPGRLQPIVLQRVGHDLVNMCAHTYILYTHTYTSDFRMWKEISWKSYYIRTENSPVSRRTHDRTVFWNNVSISWTFFWWNNFWERHQVLESTVLAESGPRAPQTRTDLDKKAECFHCSSII